MKKITLLLMVLLLGVGVKSEVLSSAETVTGDWAESVTISKSSLAEVKAGDVIAVTVTALNSWTDNGNPGTYWQCILRQAGENGSWDTLTGFDGGISTTGVFKYVLTETNVDEIKAGGLNITGKHITFNKVELLTVETEVLWSGSIATGNWGDTWVTDGTKEYVNLGYEHKGSLATACINDEISVTFTTAEGAQIAIQNANGWANLEASSGKDESHADGDHTFTYTIGNATILEIVQQNGVLVRGKNITIKQVALRKLSNRYDAVPVTIGTDGKATFSTGSKKVDFSATGITPYYASAVTTGTITFTAVASKITCGWQGYLLVGDEGVYSVPVTTADQTAPATNYLKPTGDYAFDVAASTSGTYHYIFAKKATEEPGFYKLTGDKHSLGAHKAYLETETDITPAGARVALVFSDEAETTGISASLGEKVEKASEHIYNLRGMRVTQPQKGLYIKNGKKMIIR